MLYNYASGRNYFEGVNGDNEKDPNNTIEVFVTIDKDKSQLTIFVANWLSDGEIKDETVSVNITKANKIPTEGLLYRIDYNNTNPAEIWESEMNSPTYPTKDQLDKLNEVSELINQTIKVDSSTKDSFNFKVDVPSQGLVAIIVDL